MISNTKQTKILPALPEAGPIKSDASPEEAIKLARKHWRLVAERATGPDASSAAYGAATAMHHLNHCGRYLRMAGQDVDALGLDAEGTERARKWLAMPASGPSLR